MTEQAPGISAESQGREDDMSQPASAQDRAPKDYAAEMVALGRSEPENPALYNAIRWALDDWFASTAETLACKRSEPSGCAPTFQPDHDNGDPWCDGAARYVASHVRMAGLVVLDAD